ncbi:MAG: PAS domain S-box protein [Rhodanobacter sp.]
MPITPENNYRLLVQAIVDYAIYMLDVNGYVVSWNLGAERFKGYKEDEVVGTHFSRFYTAEDRAAEVPSLALERAVQDGRFESEGWRVRKNGTRFWAHVLIDPIRNDAGELIGFAKVTRDLTERREAEESLRDDQAQFKMLVQGVTDYAIYMLDTTGHVSSWNPGAQRIKGYTREEIVGEHFSCFYTTEDRKKGEPQKNLRLASSLGRVESEGWRVRKDGTRFWAHVLIDRILDDQGKLAGFAKVTRDVTEQRRVSEELDRAREALFQSQKLESIGQLTGGVAHDFNNLLMAIIASLELIGRRVPDDPKIHVLVENAKAGAFRGAALTERMLSFARRQELRPVPVDLAELVRGMSDLLQRSLGSHITITTTFPLFLQLVFVDHNQLELALMNLLVNARDAMPEGGQVTISAQRETVGLTHSTKLPEGDFIKLVVADQGEGMDEATLARATEPFFTTKGVGKGTGLGLSMVHGLAEQSGGRLIVRSKKGEGTQIEVWLPVAADSETKAAEAEQTDPSENLPKATLDVLAIDDDALVLATLCAQLEDLGHHVTPSNSGEQALRTLQSGQHFDVVISDHAMPVMTGSQFAQRARTLRPELPIIIASGYAELPGNLAFDLPRLKKPFSQRDLASAIWGAVSNLEKQERA